MSKEQDFTVVRRHIGDRDYAVGDTRTGTMAALGHLVPHVLRPVEAKAAAAPANKAEGGAPANKAKAATAKKADAANLSADAPAQADTVAPQAGEAPVADAAATQADQAAQES